MSTGFAFVRYGDTMRAPATRMPAMPSALGDKIRAARKALKLSLEDLAEKVSSSKSYMWELENRDEPNPGADLLMRIAAALNVTTEHLLGPAVTDVTEDVTDQAFFRKYQQLDPDDKKRIRKILDTWDDE